MNETEKFDPFSSQKLSMNSTDAIISNLHSSTLTVPELSNDHSNESHCQYIGYSYPKKDDPIESGYSTPLKSCSLTKKTVYEVVV